MKKLSEIRGENALDVLADIIEPLADILTDEDVIKMYQVGEKLRAISTAIKNHKESVIKILALLDGEDVETYDPPLILIPIKIIEVLNDPDVQTVFSSQGQMTLEKSSGSATGNTEEIETK